MEDNRFAIIGAAGYVSPRHMRAIVESGGEIQAAMDPRDSVGILDRFSPNCQFFTEHERFWRWFARCDFEGRQRPNWVSICSPNWLHDSHIRMALIHGCKVIVEKPVVITPRNLRCLMEEFPDFSDRVFIVHQLRWHPSGRRLKEFVDRVIQNDPMAEFEVKIDYHTPRGPWYGYSWKGDESRSGGPIFNLGIHFLDLLCWVFGDHRSVFVRDRCDSVVSGEISFESASVDFYLSTNRPDGDRSGPGRQFVVRSGLEEFKFEFDSGFEGLHDDVYRSAMSGLGVGLDDALGPTRLAHEIRTSMT